jgi:diaminopimelate epimerase
VNVEYIAPDGDGGLNLRVWERGAGITEACGTGACAAAFEAHRWGLVGDEVRVTMPGGAAVVQLDGDGGVTLVGPSVFIADVDVALAAERQPVEA